MAVTITRVSGLGGNPPTSIYVEGTATSCEKVRVISSCSSHDVVVDVINGQWNATLDNDKHCPCGDSFKVTAYCDIGAAAEATSGFTLACGDCPLPVISTSAAGECVNGKRQVTISISINPPLTSTQALLLNFGDGTMGVSITSSGPFSVTHEYAPNTTGYDIIVSTILPTGCNAVTAHVNIPDCPSCCPVLTIEPPQVIDCGSNPSSASFLVHVAVPNGCPTPASYNWTITEQSTGQQWFRTGGTSLDTLSGWVAATGGAAGPINLDAGGNFSVAVAAAGNYAACNQGLATQTFTVRRRCPRIVGSMTQNSQNGCTFSFSVPVENPCNLPLTYQWTFGDGTSATTQTNTVAHTYATGTTTSQHVSVSVVSPACPNVVASLTVTPTCRTTPPPDDCPPGQRRDSTGKCVPIEDGNGGFNLCAGLLLTAVILILLGGVAIIVGVCSAIPWIWIGGAAAAALGLGLFILWIAICSRFTPCSVMRTIHCMLFWIVAVIAPLIVLIAGVFGGLPCFLAAAGAWGGWGTLYAWLGFIMRGVNCTPTC